MILSSVDYRCLMLIVWLVIRQLFLNEELSFVYFVTEILYLRKHPWELSNTTMSLSVDEIDDLVFAVLCRTWFLYHCTFL